MKEIDVIIVNWNTKEYLQSCVESVVSQVVTSASVRIHVVDNNSDDGSAEMILDKFSSVDLVRNDCNVGFAKGNNQIWKDIQADYVLLFNSDAEFKLTTDLQRMLNGIEQNERIGILGPKLLNTDNTLQKSVKGEPTLSASIMWMLKAYLIPGLSNIWPLSSYLLPNFNYTKEQDVEDIMGAVFLVRRKVWERIGFFDESYWFWFEETDFCARARKGGFTVHYFPWVEVIHHGGSSIKNVISIHKQRIWNRGLWRYFRKHKPLWQNILLIPAIILSYGIAVLISVKKMLAK